MSDQQLFNAGLIQFLDSSPTPYHAVASMKEALSYAGFIELDEGEAWSLSPGGKYYVIRHGSSIAAFTVGSEPVTEQGWRMVGAHTDSPCLKVKPKPELSRQGYMQLGVEVYGGALLNPWFDRDLSMAGRVNFVGENGKVSSKLIDFDRPLAVIPSLAIHLDREANTNRSINAQTHLPPLLMMAEEKGFDFREFLAREAGVEEVIDYDISLYNKQGAGVVGANSEFISSARLDNLLSCYIGLQAILHGDGSQHTVLICNDHEEVGSASAVGAQGPMLRSLLSRIAGDSESLDRALSRSMMISADNAHAVHPNFADKHDGNHGPIINGGPAIKLNSNQRYATSSETSAIFKQLCVEAGVKYQSFVMRNDMACGSTIGPITATELGVKTIDVGIPTFAMHSIRELAGSEDGYRLNKVLTTFYRSTI